MTTAVATKNDLSDGLERLVRDLKSTTKLLRVDDYPDVTEEQLNRYMATQGTLVNPHFGEAPGFWIDNGRFIPGRMRLLGHQYVVSKIASLLGRYTKLHGVGGRVCNSRGLFLSKHGDPDRPPVRAPDLFYLSRAVWRAATETVPTDYNGWTYDEAPFQPSLVVEVDSLAGDRSQRAALEDKMRNVYFPVGVQLGWVIDPHPDVRMMLEYCCDEHGHVQCATDTSWRDLDGRDVVPGFRLSCLQLEMVVNQASGSSSEDDVDVQCPYPGCGQRFQSPGRFAGHVEKHRKERAKAKYVARQRTTTTLSSENGEEDDASDGGDNDAHETRCGCRDYHRRRQFRPYEGAQTHVGGRVDHASATPRGSRREDP